MTEEKKSKKSGAPSLSHQDALSADLGPDALREAVEQGYAGYVWDEDRSEYTALEVGNHDQSGPEKKSGAYDVERAMNDNFVRPDRLDESTK